MKSAGKATTADLWSAKTPPPKNVDAFIRSSPKEAQPKLREMRALVRSLASEAEEVISYRMPTYKLKGQPFVAFAGFKNHIGFYPMSGSFLDRYKSELKDYVKSTGAVRFPISEPLPVALIKRMIRDRIKSIG
jgi:uncharacterized protein YdhG (YjbR/CyaY superfamily)